MTNSRHEIVFLLADLPDVDSLRAGLPEQIDIQLQQIDQGMIKADLTMKHPESISHEPLGK